MAPTFGRNVYTCELRLGTLAFSWWIFWNVLQLKSWENLLNSSRAQNVKKGQSKISEKKHVQITDNITGKDYAHFWQVGMIAASCGYFKIKWVIYIRKKKIEILFSCICLFSVPTFKLIATLLPCLGMFVARKKAEVAVKTLSFLAWSDHPKCLLNDI